MYILNKILVPLLLCACVTATANASEEGIAVHGHWKLEVFNPDGSLDRVIEFENALTPDGPVALVGLLTGALSGSEWEVGLADDGASMHICGPGGSPEACIIRESTSTIGGEHSLNLVVTTLMSDTQIQLQGSITATNGGAVDQVSTFLWICPVGVAPFDCEGNGIGGGFAFTSASISPLAVSNGQLVQVTVTISFS